MAKAVTLKNNNNEEVYPVTDISLVNGNVPTGRIADNAITTDKVADGAVTSDKLAWNTLTNYHSLRHNDTFNVTGSSITNVPSLSFTCDKAGTYFLAANGNCQIYVSSSAYPRIGIYKGDGRLTYAAVSLDGSSGQRSWSTFTTAQLAVGDVIRVAVMGGPVQLFEGQNLFAIRIG